MIKLYHKGVVLRCIEKGENIKSTMSRVKGGDFILSGIDARNGAFGIVPDDLDGAIVTNDFWCLDPDKKSIDKDFLLFLTTTDFFDYICKQSSDGVTQRIRLQREKFFNFEITLPPVLEQKLLVSKLKELEFLSQKLSSEIKYQCILVKKLRQQLLQDALQGKLVDQDPNDGPASVLLKKIKAEKEQLINEKKLKRGKDLLPLKVKEIPFEIPVNWIWCRLDEMSINCDGGRVPISQSERERREKIYSYYGASGVIDLIDGYTHDGKYLLIGEDGANLIAKSTPIAFIAEGKFWVNNHAHVLDFFDDITLNYMKYCLNTIDIIPFITGGFQPKLSQGNLNLLPIPLPPLSEQFRIVQKIEQLFLYLNELEESIKQSSSQNEKLMQQVLKEALQNH